MKLFDIMPCCSRNPNKNLSRLHTRVILAIIAGISLSILALCSCEYMMKKMYSEESEMFARVYLDILLKGDYEQGMNLLAPEFKSDKAKEAMVEVHEHLDYGNPYSIQMINFRVRQYFGKDKNTPGARLEIFTYLLRFEDAVVVADITVEKIDDKLVIDGFNVNDIPKEAIVQNDFTLSGKSLRHFILLLLAILIPIFIIYNLIMCFRTKLRRKWLWVAFIAVGIGRVIINWTTGKIFLQFFTFNVLGAAYMRDGLFGPWMITVTFPLGAIVFFFKRRNMRIHPPQESQTIERGPFELPPAEVPKSSTINV